jgi:hypothetical protein
MPPEELDGPLIALTRPAARTALRDYAHLAVLSTFALAQPLFDLLRRNPEFFAARGAPGLDIVSFAILLVALPPALLLAVELLAGLAGPRARRALHLSFVALLVALLVVQALKRLLDAPDGVLLALTAAAGIAAAAGYARAPIVRAFMNVLSPAPVVLLALFLLLSPVSKLAFPSEVSARTIAGAAKAPIVVVLFDELPLTSLLDDRGRVDPVRYPAFAALARTSTWFPNAYTVYDSTERAQPAIMDGNYPAADLLPTASDHPDSIFALFGGTHRMNVAEEATSVCPRDLCADDRLEEPYSGRMESMAADLGLVWLHMVAPPGLEARLPAVSDTWGDFGLGALVRANLGTDRGGRFDAWVRRIVPGGRPQLSLKHTLLPHMPWQHLPDGRRYRGVEDPVAGLSKQSYRDPTQDASLYQRHLLQLEYTDSRLGGLLRHLKRTGLYDGSLIVVTADHGIAFGTGRYDRRKITRDNAEHIAPIPLFVKAPGQREGAVDEAYAETVDILPTIADVLDLRPRVRSDGRSAFGPEVRRRRVVRILERGTLRPLRFGVVEWERRKAAGLARKLRLFGVGRDGPLRLFRIGPHRDLLFRPLARYPIEPAADATRFADTNDYGAVDPRSATLPAWVTGRLEGVPPGRDLAVAVNGRIAAVTRSLRLATDPSTLVATMVPASFFRAGRNRVELFEVRRAGTTVVLRRLGDGVDRP